tara:strand:- start:123 stop:257 length:135 start_codon:yes stop_codon:yes gene_type:complete
MIRKGSSALPFYFILLTKFVGLNHLPIFLLKQERPVPACGNEGR